MTTHPSLSRPGVPTPGAAQNCPAWSSEPPRSRQVPAAPGAGPVPTCPCLRAGAGAVLALALAGAAAASGGAGSAPRPRVTGGRGGREPASCFGKHQEEKQLSWQPRAPVPALLGPPPASAARPADGSWGWPRWDGAGGGFSGSMVRAPTPCPAPPLLCLRAPPAQQQLALPVPGFPKCTPNGGAACPACREGYECPRDVHGSSTASTGWWRSQEVLLRQTGLC